MIAYKDKACGVFLVPNPSMPFTTDLASVPQLFTWLVPRSGVHLPAAILHDGMIPLEAGTYIGQEIRRQEADRIFRDAMRDLGTGWIRRWLAWTAVAVDTEATEGFGGGRWKTPYGWLILGRLGFFVLVILLLGIRATFDLFDRDRVLREGGLVPWMDSSSIAYQLLAGGLFAVLVPAVLSLLFWGRQMVRAALILGIAMALFLHATALVAFLLLVYNALEATIAATVGRGSWRAAGVGFALVGAAVMAVLVLAKVALAIPNSWLGWSLEVPYAEGIGKSIGRLGVWFWDLPSWLFLLPLAGSLGLWLLSRSAHGAGVILCEDACGRAAD